MTTDSMPAEILDYLEYLDDPTKLLPTDEITEVEKNLQAEGLSRADKILLDLELIKLTNVSDDQLIKNFTKAVPKFVSSMGISLDAARDVFSKHGVPDAVLDELVAVPTTATGRVSLDDVVKVIATRRSQFTKKDIEEATGASTGTVGKALKAALRDKTIVAVGGNPKIYTPK